MRNVKDVYVSAEFAYQHLKGIYESNLIGRYANGDYILMRKLSEGAYEVECESEDELIQDMMYDMYGLSSIRKILAEVGKDLPFIDELIIEFEDDTVESIQFDAFYMAEERTGWLYLEDGTSVEITEERENLKPEDQFFSIRRHCSEKDFDDDTYHKTMGVIEETAGDLTVIKEEVIRMIEKYGYAPPDDRLEIRLPFDDGEE